MKNKTAINGGEKAYILSEKFLTHNGFILTSCIHFNFIYFESEIVQKGLKGLPGDKEKNHKTVDGDARAAMRAVLNYEYRKPKNNV